MADHSRWFRNPGLPLDTEYYCRLFGLGMIGYTTSYMGLADRALAAMRLCTILPSASPLSHVMRVRAFSGKRRPPAGSMASRSLSFWEALHGQEALRRQFDLRRHGQHLGSN